MTSTIFGAALDSADASEDAARAGAAEATKVRREMVERFRFDVSFSEYAGPSVVGVTRGIFPVKIVESGAAMSSNTVREIERAIGALTLEELEELYSWLERHYPQPIDTRLQSDLASGRLDKAIFRALEDEKNGRIQPL